MITKPKERTTSITVKGTLHWNTDYKRWEVREVITPFSFYIPHAVEEQDRVKLSDGRHGTLKEMMDLGLEGTEAEVELWI